MVEYKKQIDGLRFFCFLGVFLVHTDFSKYWWGSYGVAIFFAISGFLITKILLAHEEQTSWVYLLRQFYIRRFLRIFPAYYLLLIVLFLATAQPHKISMLAYVYNIRIFIMSLENYLLQAFEKWNLYGFHLWSLSVEEQFYILYPLTLIAVPKKWRMIFLLGLLLFSIVMRFVMAAFLPQTPYGILLPICGEYIVWGCMLGMVDDSGVAKHVRFEWVVWGSLVLIAVTFFMMMPTVNPLKIVAAFPHPLQSVLAIGFGGLVWGLWNSERLWLSRFLSFPVFTYLGKISYGLYLIHVFTWPMYANLTKKWHVFNRVPPEAGYLVLSVVIAMISWHLWECPMNSFKRFFPYARMAQGSLK